MEQPAIDEGKLEPFVMKTVGDMSATALAATVMLGEKLGLYKAMAGAGPLSASDVATRVCACDEVREGRHIGDIGPHTSKLFAEIVGAARTVIWSGPMGVCELAPFQSGTFEVARAAASTADRGATVIVGGGDSAAATVAAGVVDRITHVSTGGSASLELLSGKEMPAVAALSDR